MKKDAILRELFSYLKLIFFTWLTVMLTVNFLFRPVIVEGRSMYPTLENNDFGFSNIIGYKLEGINRFDIVIIQPPGYDDLIVKRVIGLPNEEIEYRNDKLYIDGVYFEEVFLDTDYAKGYRDDDRSFTGDFLIKLGDDEYLCLGDNRPRSSDSRVLGPFSRSQIVGKSVFILYPFSRFLQGN